MVYLYQRMIDLLVLLMFHLIVMVEIDLYVHFLFVMMANPTTKQKYETKCSKMKFFFWILKQPSRFGIIFQHFHTFGKREDCSRIVKISKNSEFFSTFTQKKQNKPCHEYEQLLVAQTRSQF